MDSFNSYLLRKLYKETAHKGDKLAKIEPLIDWNKFCRAHALVISLTISQGFSYSLHFSARALFHLKSIRYLLSASNSSSTI